MLPPEVKAPAGNRGTADASHASAIFSYRRFRSAGSRAAVRIKAADSSVPAPGSIAQAADVLAEARPEELFVEPFLYKHTSSGHYLK
jgi:hypothetical protein